MKNDNIHRARTKNASNALQSHSSNSNSNSNYNGTKSTSNGNDIVKVVAAVTAVAMIEIMIGDCDSGNDVPVMQRLNNNSNNNSK